MNICPIYPYTDAAHAKNALSPEDYWRIFHVNGNRRIAAIGEHIERYKGRISSIISIGDAEKIYDYGQFRMHRRVPIVMEIKSYDDGEPYIITNSDFLGLIIERDGSYTLFNVFE